MSHECLEETPSGAFEEVMYLFNQAMYLVLLILRFQRTYRTRLLCHQLFYFYENFRFQWASFLMQYQQQLLQVSEEVASDVRRSWSVLSRGLSETSAPSLFLISESRLLADSALFHPTLLSLLYFPTEQRFGMYFPLFILYFLPAAFLLPRVVHFLIYRSP